MILNSNSALNKVNQKTPLLKVRNLKVSFSRENEVIRAVRGIDLTLQPGEILAIVGESGCGKSVTAQAMMRLLPEGPKTTVEGQVLFNGVDLLLQTQKQMKSMRGRDIGMIFQDPMTSLNPTMTIGRQIEEVLKEHLTLTPSERHLRCLDLLQKVGISDPIHRIKQYPHEFSGGMRQRVVIAIGVACQPKLIIADEPTTALDVTVQAQILEIIRQIQAKSGNGVILITHDLAVVASFAHNVVVMYAGEIMEQGSVDDIFYRPAHPYTRALLGSLPSQANRAKRLDPIEGNPPHLGHQLKGCPFTARCKNAMKICPLQHPDQFKVGANHFAACHLHHPDFVQRPQNKKNE